MALWNQATPESSSEKPDRRRQHLTPSATPTAATPAAATSAPTPAPTACAYTREITPPAGASRSLVPA